MLISGSKVTLGGVPVVLRGGMWVGWVAPSGHESLDLASFPDQVLPCAWLVWLLCVECVVYFRVLGWNGLRMISNPNSLFLGHWQVYTLHLVSVLKSSNSIVEGKPIILLLWSFMVIVFSEAVPVWYSVRF